MLNNLNLMKHKSRTLSESLQKLFPRDRECSDDNYLNFILEDKENNYASVHPMDIFLLIFFSCDKMYRQNFVVKVAKCQLSLPLIAFDPFSQRLTNFSFSFQKVFKECYFSDNRKYEFPIAEQKFNIISALRIGNEGMVRSKSKLLNDLLSVSHDYFCHRNCEGSTSTNYLLNKTIEIGWYLPSEEEDSFEDPLSFLNLRGDATYLQKQITFLLSVSNVLLIFISPQHLKEDNIKTLEYTFEQAYSGNSSEEIPHLILVIESIEKNCYDLTKLKNYKPNVSNLIKLCKNEAEDKSKLIRGIKTGLKNSIQKCSINDLIEHSNKMGIITEFNEKEIQMNSEEVNAILNHELPKDPAQIDLSVIKIRMLPLQGDSWRQTAENSRKCYRENTADIQHAQFEERDQNKNINILSNYLRTNPSFSMQHILRKAKKYESCNSEVFWRLFQNELDKLSKWHIPELYKQYREERDLLFDQNRNNPRPKQAGTQEKLELICRDISKSSFGIEHVFRELGQIYEGCMLFRGNELHKIIDNLRVDPNDLIMMASQLLLSGFQLEILDGDVSHIPIKWVSAILTQVSSLIGPSKRIYVISVLGIQSSGKSTLLNTMFGLEFAVSAGKCTKGAFMHLIHIEAEAAEQLGYDYILVVDTEGLRAPELMSDDSYLHDNEIATFAIGLADLTIINILGEYSTEMQDILQITIYALIRMRKASVKPKCIFVHQNATAINIENKLAIIISKFVQLLDDITLTVAKKEKVSDLFQNFNSVIEFDPKEDIFYFPTLFGGDPPMAPINPGYCEAANKLRKNILLKSAQCSHSCQTLLEIAMKVGDLWNSVLKEDFVFNYRNVRELNALYELDYAQSQWAALFTQQLSEWVKVKAKLIRSKEGDELDTFWKEVNTELEQKAYTFCKEEQDYFKNRFFKSHQKKEFFLSRESKSDIFFISLREKEYNYSLSSLRETYNIQKQANVIDKMYNNAEKNLFDKIEELKNCKEGFKNLSRTEITHIFEEKWNELIKDIPNRVNIELIDIRIHLKNLLIESTCLQDVKRADKDPILSNFSNHIDFCNNNPFPIIEKCINLNQEYSLEVSRVDKESETGELTIEDKERLVKAKLESIVNKVRRDCDELVATKCDSNIYFSTSSFKWIIGNVKETCESCEFALPNQFINDLIFYECCRKVTHFEELQEDYIQNISVTAMLESKKPEYENYFITKWNGIAEEIIVAFNLTTFFLKEINYLAREKMKKWMYNDFLKQNKRYSTKFQLHMTVLTDLCQQENCGEYISYLQNPIDYIEFWLLDKMKKIYSNNSNNEAAITIFKIELQSLITFCIESAKNANDSIIKEMGVNLSKVPTSSKKNIQDFWKAHFIDKVNKEIHFNANDVLNFFDANTICDYERFFKAFKESLGNFEIDCTPLIFCIELKDKIIRSYFQCTEYCLFCSELCIRHTGDDKHSCGTFHRPHCLKSENIRQYELNDLSIGVELNDKQIPKNKEKKLIIVIVQKKFLKMIFFISKENLLLETIRNLPQVGRSWGKMLKILFIGNGLLLIFIKTYLTKKLIYPKGN